MPFLGPPFDCCCAERSSKPTPRATHYGMFVTNSTCRRLSRAWDRSWYASRRAAGPVLREFGPVHPKLLAPHCKHALNSRVDRDLPLSCRQAPAPRTSKHPSCSGLQRHCAIAYSFDLVGERFQRFVSPGESSWGAVSPSSAAQCRDVVASRGVSGFCPAVSVTHVSAKARNEETTDKLSFGHSFACPHLVSSGLPVPGISHRAL